MVTKTRKGRKARKTKARVVKAPSAVTALVVRPKGRAEVWGRRISALVGQSVAAIVTAGRMLVAAKAALGHGEWGRLFADHLVPFSQNTAGQLMQIATHPQLSKSASVQKLPASWGTLYELTKVEPKRLRAAFKAGAITPAMSRGDVAALLPTKAKPRRPAARVRPPVPAGALDQSVETPAADAALARLMQGVTEALDALSPADGADVLRRLEQAIRDRRVGLAAKAS